MLDNRDTVGNTKTDPLEAAREEIRKSRIAAIGDMTREQALQEMARPFAVKAKRRNDALAAMSKDLGGPVPAGIAGLDPSKRIENYDQWVESQEPTQRQKNQAFGDNARFRLAQSLLDMYQGRSPRTSPMLAATDAIGAGIKDAGFSAAGSAFSGVAEAVQDVVPGLIDLSDTIYNLAAGEPMPRSGMLYTSDVQRDRAMESMYGDREIPAGIRGAVQNSNFAADVARGLAQVGLMVATAGGSAPANAGMLARSRWLFTRLGPQAIVASQAGRAGEAKGREYDELIDRINSGIRDANVAFKANGLDPVEEWDKSRAKRFGYAIGEAGQTYAIEWLGNMIQSKYFVGASRGLNGLKTSFAKGDGAKEFAIEIAKAIGISGGAEGAEELAQEFVSQVITHMMTPGEQEIDWESVFYSAGVGATVGALFGGGSTYLGSRTTRNRYREITEADALNEYRNGRSDVQARSVGSAAVQRIMAGEPRPGDRGIATRFAQSLRRDGIEIGSVTGEDLADPKFAQRLYDAAPELARALSSSDIEGTRQMAEWLVGKNGKTTKDQRERFLANIKAATARGVQSDAAKMVAMARQRAEQFIQMLGDLVAGVPANDARRNSLRRELYLDLQVLRKLEKVVEPNSEASRLLEETTAMIESALETQGDPQADTPSDPADVDMDPEAAEAVAEAVDDMPVDPQTAPIDVEEATTPDIEGVEEAIDAATEQAQEAAEGPVEASGPEVAAGPEPAPEDATERPLQRDVVTKLTRTRLRANKTIQMLEDLPANDARRDSLRRELYLDLQVLRELEDGVKTSRDARSLLKKTVAKIESALETQGDPQADTIRAATETPVEPEQAQAGDPPATDGEPTTEQASEAEPQAQQVDELLATFTAQVKRDSPDANVTEVEATTPLRKKVAKVIESQGRKVRFVETDAPVSVDAMISPDGGTVVIRVLPEARENSLTTDQKRYLLRYGYLQAALHELFHGSYRDDPQVRAALLRLWSNDLPDMLRRANWGVEGSESQVQEESVILAAVNMGDLEPSGVVSLLADTGFKDRLLDMARRVGTRLFAKSNSARKVLLDAVEAQIKSSQRKAKAQQAKGKKAGKSKPDPKPKPKPRTKPEPSEQASTEPREPLKPAAWGKASRIRVPEYGDLNVRYAVAEVDDLEPSHFPSMDVDNGFKVNPRGDANERPYDDRSAGRSSRETVVGGVGNWRPGETYSDASVATVGPSIVDGYRVVLGGNGRLMIIMLEYGRKGNKVKEATIEAAKRFGIDPDIVAGMKKPVIVRVVEGEFKRGELSRALNYEVTTGKTSEVDALSIVNAMDADTLESVASVASRFDTVAEFLSDAAATTSALGTMREAGAISQAQFDTIWSRTAKKVTPEGKAKLEMILLAMAVPDIENLQFLPASIKAKILKSLPHLIRARRFIGDSWQQSMSNAIEGIVAMDARGGYKDVREFIEQMSLDPLPVATDPHGIRIMRALREEGPRKFLGKMRSLTEAILGDGQDSLMGEDISPEAVFRAEFQTDIADAVESSTGKVSFQQRGMKKLYDSLAQEYRSGPVRSTTLGDLLDFVSANVEDFNDDVGLGWGDAIAGINASGLPEKTRRKTVQVFPRDIREKDKISAVQLNVFSRPDTVLHEIAHAITTNTTYRLSVKAGVDGQSKGDRYLQALRKLKTNYERIAGYDEEIRSKDGPGSIALLLDVYLQAVDQYLSEQPAMRRRLYWATRDFMGGNGNSDGSYVDLQSDDHRPKVWHDGKETIPVTRVNAKRASGKSLIGRRQSDRSARYEGRFNYEISNLDEFIAGAMANTAFRQWLNNIPYKGGKRSLWKRFVEAIQGIIGLPVKQGSLLEQALSSIEGIVFAEDRIANVPLAEVASQSLNPGEQGSLFQQRLRAESTELDRRFAEAMQRGDTEDAVEAIHTYGMMLSMLDPDRYGSMERMAGDVIDGMSRNGKRGFSVEYSVYTPEMSRPNGQNWRVSHFRTTEGGVIAVGHTEFDDYESARKTLVSELVLKAIQRNVKIQERDGVPVPPSQSFDLDTLDFSVDRPAFQSRQRMEEYNPNLPTVRDKTFVSALRQAIEEAPAKAMKPDGWRQYIRSLVSKGTVKADEVEWSGIMDVIDMLESVWNATSQDNYRDNPGLAQFWDAKGRIPISAIIDKASIKLVETQYGDVGTTAVRRSPDYLETTRFQNYALHDTSPNAEEGMILRKNRSSSMRYEEVLLLAPGATTQADAHNNSHFIENNIVAHARYSVREDGDRTTLFVDEIQSDWAQEGRQRGFRDPNGHKPYLVIPFPGELSVQRPKWFGSPEGKRLLEDTDATKSIMSLLDERTQSRFGSVEGVLAEIKGIMSKVGVEPELLVRPRPTWDGQTVDQVGGYVFLESIDGSMYPLIEVSRPQRDNLPYPGPFVDSTSKWVTLALKRIIARAVDIGADSITLPTGKAVKEKVGGQIEGHTEFYEKIVPAALKKLLKKMGADAQITESEMGIGSYTVDITQEMREAVYEGLPMFQQRIGNPQVSLSAWSRVRSSIVWEFTTLERAMRQLVEREGYISGEDDPLALLQNSPGWVARDNDNFERREMAPLQRSLRKAAKRIFGKQWKSKIAEFEMDVSQLAFLRHLPYVLAQIRRLKHEAMTKAQTKKEIAAALAMEETVYGLDEAEAYRMIDALDQKYGSEIGTLEALGEQVRKINARTLDLLHAEGIVSDEVYLDLKTKYPKYVPVQVGFMSEDERSQFVGASTISQPANQLRKLFGGTESDGRNLEELWAAQVMATDLDRRRANRKVRDNRAEMALFDLARVGRLTVDGQKLATAIEAPKELRAEFQRELKRLIRMKTKEKGAPLTKTEIHDLVPIAWEYARRQIQQRMGQQLSNKEVMRLRANKTVEDPVVVADIDSLSRHGVTLQEHSEGKTQKSMKRSNATVSKMIAAREANRYIYRKGDELFLRINDKTLSDSLLLRTPDFITRIASDDDAKASTLARAYLGAFNTRKWFLTAGSPMFWLREFVRQPFTVAVNTERMAQMYGIDRDEALRNLRLRSRIPVVSSLAKLWPIIPTILMMAGKKKARRGWQREFVEMLDKGGVAMSQIWNSADMDNHEQKMMRAIARARGGDTSSPYSTPRQIFAVLRSAVYWTAMVPTAVDMLNRYEAYRAIKLSTNGDVIRAGQVARESTIDFSKKAGSELGKFMNTWTTFFRAAVQGGDQLVKSFGLLKTDPKALLNPRQAAAFATRPVVLFILSSFILELITEMFLDCEENPDDCIPDYQRNDNWVIPIPPRNEDGKVATVMIPKPPGFRVFANIGARAARIMLGKENPTTSMVDTFAEFAGQLGPVAIPDKDRLDIVNIMASLAGSLGGEQLVRLGINRDWRGMPIYMEPFGEDGTMDSRRAMRDTPEFWQKAARILHSVTATPASMMPGADRMDYLDSGVDVAPESLQYLTEGIVGTPARWLGFMSEIITNPEEELGRYARDVDTRPVIRIFASQTGSARAIRQSWSEVSRQYKVMERDIKDAEGDRDEQQRRLDGFGAGAYGYNTWKAAERALRSRSEKTPGLYMMLRMAREAGDSKRANQISDYIVEVQREALIRIRSQQMEAAGAE